MIRTILIACFSAAAAALLVACAPAPPLRPAAPSVCEALRPDMPVKYHGGPDGKGGVGYDTSDTIARVRLANARFAASCPEIR